jgi:esterase/lipase superfamily enzyme
MHTMSKIHTSWHSERLDRSVNVVRYGHYGKPVLLFPTAGGDAEECERFHMLDVLAPLLEAGRVKVYSVDSVAGKAWLTEEKSTRHGGWVQNRFDAFVYDELVPAIRKDCNDPSIEMLTAGASIGAFNALAVICRHPDVFSHAICMSGTYDPSRFLSGEITQDYYYSSPLDFLPGLGEGEQLSRLRERFVLLAHGTGRWESPEQSWRVADVLGSKGVPNRVDAWGTEWDHDWPTWRRMLPHYLEELLPS